jgi:hypothetical protein
MNVPFHFFYFPTYEFFRSLLKSDPSEHDPKAHIVAGGGYALVPQTYPKRAQLSHMLFYLLPFSPVLVRQPPP